MSTATKPTNVAKGDNCIVLGDVDWDVYERLRDAPGSRNIRMTYVEGELELMSPSKLHERIAELLAQLVIVWTEENNIPRQSCGTMTFRRKDQLRGLEPDKCFYIQNERSVRHCDELNLAVDPPPDLVIEVDVSSSSRNRLPIYAAMGVPEVWRWKNNNLFPLILNAAGDYEERRDSESLPGFPFAAAIDVLQNRHAMDETTLVRQFRERVRAGE